MATHSPHPVHLSSSITILPPIGSSSSSTNEKACTWHFFIGGQISGWAAQRSLRINGLTNNTPHNLIHLQSSQKCQGDGVIDNSKAISATI